MIDFTNRVVLVTGAAGGIGAATARTIAGCGGAVVVHDVREGGRLAELAGELGEHGHPVAADLVDAAGCVALWERAVAWRGRVDVLINNAGIIGSHLPAEQLTGVEATEILDTNEAGIVRVTHAFLPLLRGSEHPAVINVSSGMGSFALTHDPERVESKPIGPLYTASKAAVTMLSTQYAKALPDIRVNAADPGYTATDFNAHSGHQTVTEGTDAIVALATERADAGTGRFIDRSGPVRW